MNAMVCNKVLQLVKHNTTAHVRTHGPTYVSAGVHSHFGNCLRIGVREQQRSVMRSCHLENQQQKTATALHAVLLLPAKHEEPCKHSTPQPMPMVRLLGALRALQGSQPALQMSQHMDVYPRNHTAEAYGLCLF